MNDRSEQAAFPQYFSFTITNHCNLRCWMCGQWSEEGYIQNDKGSLRSQMRLEDWVRVVDELADHGVKSVLLRGGEPFLYPGILELLAYLRLKDIFVSIDTNGTLLKDFAAEIVRLGGIHLTVSIDGPEPIHDRIRGAAGTFNRVREGLACLQALEDETGRSISQSLNFTILPWSVSGLGEMPNVARSLGVKTMAIVPYFYFPEAVGETYQHELETHFGCPAFSWRGFHHEASGVDFVEFQQQYRRYLANLGEVYDFPYMAFREVDYRTWFESPTAPVGGTHCANVEKLIDIQPNGDANFCVDFPDFTIGNVRFASIEDLWNSERAERFRAYRRVQPLAVCFRCGAKYMGEM
jgi:MoaA/NifB/PqqE/SkfB family radical SAM enzyme